jgi:hypothetical protein
MVKAKSMDVGDPLASGGRRESEDGRGREE